MHEEMNEKTKPVCCFRILNLHSRKISITIKTAISSIGRLLIVLKSILTMEIGKSSSHISIFTFLKNNVLKTRFFKFCGCLDIE